MKKSYLIRRDPKENHKLNCNFVAVTLCAYKILSEIMFLKTLKVLFIIEIKTFVTKESYPFLMLRLSLSLTIRDIINIIVNFTL